MVKFGERLKLGKRLFIIYHSPLCRAFHLIFNSFTKCPKVELPLCIIVVQKLKGHLVQTNIDIQEAIQETLKRKAYSVRIRWLWMGFPTLIYLRQGGAKVI